MPPPRRPLPKASTALLHPSQGFSTVDDAGQACFVSYQYRAAQALALAAQSSRTPFDPCSLNLPSVGALVGFYHACLGFPVKQTWLEAIKAGNCNSFDRLTYANAARYCPDTDETIMGHLAQQHQNVWSTKPKPPAPNQALLTPAISPQPSTLPSNEIYIRIYPISKLYKDDTGWFPIKACSGNQYVMIAYHAKWQSHPPASLQKQEQHPPHCFIQRHHDGFCGQRSLSRSPNLGQQSQCGLQAHHHLYLASQLSVGPSGYASPELC
jgi:hypothetical protein